MDFDDPKVQELFFIIHQDLPREGPGLDEETGRAFRMIPDLPDFPRILDIGCGPGAQTFALADLCDGSITAIDFYEQFVHTVNKRAAKTGYKDYIRAIEGDMSQLDFRNHSFDLIWSEGAIYIMGFEAGLNAWKRLVKPGGYIVVSEAVYLTDDPPQAVRDFWNEEYPAITDIAGCRKIAAEAGYEIIGDFTLPPEAWWAYYKPIEERLQLLKDRWAKDEDAMEIWQMHADEITMYREHGEHYGYQFFILQRPK